MPPGLYYRKDFKAYTDVSGSPQKLLASITVRGSRLERRHEHIRKSTPSQSSLIPPTLIVPCNLVSSSLYLSNPCKPYLNYAFLAYLPLSSLIWSHPYISLVL